MPNAETILQLTGSYGPFLAIALATYLLVETLFRVLARNNRERSTVNKRLKVQEKAGDGQAALIELRRKRGLSPDGRYVLPLLALNRSLLRSGLSIGLNFLLFAMAALATITGSMALVFSAPAILAIALAGLAGFVFPLLLLALCRRRRLRRLEEQLPEAIDVMVRSLRAGHPIPVALAMVGREMPDPAGTEFGTVSDEMTYGLDLATAMGNLRERTGHTDIALLAVAVSIQSKTGGNLADLLSSIGRMIRERYRVRRKIQSLSAEGRFSSIALSIIPVVIYLVVLALAPSYYGEVKHDPVFMPAVYFGCTLWLFGVITIRRMVNFKI